MAVRRQVEYGGDARRALGHLGVGLQRRRPPRQLSVQGLRRARASASSAAWATNWWSRPTPPALAAMVDPRARPREPAAPGRDGRRGRLRLLRGHRLHARARRRARDEPRRPAAAAAGRGRARLPGPPPGHDARGAGQRPARRRMVERFHADPRVQATELLLQERVPRHAPITQPRPVEETRASRRRRRRQPSAASARRTRAFPHAQFLSNGNYVTVVTNAGGGASFCRGRAVTRYRDDATRDPGSQFIYLRDVRSGPVWSADATSRRGDGAGGLRRHVPRREGDVPPPRRRASRPSSTSRSRPRTTSRCAGWR